MRYGFFLLAALYLAGCQTYAERHPELYTYEGNPMINDYTLNAEVVKWVRINLEGGEPVVMAFWLPRNCPPGEEVFLCSMACDRFSPEWFEDLVSRTLWTKISVMQARELESSLDDPPPIPKRDDDGEAPSNLLTSDHGDLERSLDYGGK